MNRLAYSAIRVAAGCLGFLAAKLPQSARDGLARALFAARPRRLRVLRRAYCLGAYEVVRSLLLTDRREPLVVEILCGTGARLRADLRTKTGRHLAFRGEHEPDVVELMQRLYEPGSVALDIGASVGFFSTYLGLLAAPHEGRVLAFEPFDVTYERLTENVALNHLQGVVRPYQTALSDDEGQSTYFINPFNDGGGGLSQFTDGVSDGERHYSLEQVERMGFSNLEATVDVASLDRLLGHPEVRDFLGEERTVSLVKCDVEGGELGVLRGSEGLLRGGRSGAHAAWIVEVSTNIVDVFALFSGAGYRAFRSALTGPKPVDARSVDAGANVLFMHTDDDRLPGVLAACAGQEQPQGGAHSEYS